MQLGEMTFGLYGLLWFYSIIGMVWLIKQFILATVWIMQRLEMKFRAEEERLSKEKTE